MRGEAVQRRPKTAESERFVGFAFAGARLLTEIDEAGAIVYAAGAFRTMFQRPAESFVGTLFQGMIAPVDQGVVERALTLLGARGRLSPVTVRVANAEATRVALAGLALPVEGRAPRLCLTFADLPEAVGAGAGVSAGALARACAGHLQAGAPAGLGLLDLGALDDPASSSVAAALRSIAPDALASELAPGRFGVLRAHLGDAELRELGSVLEATLKGQGLAVAVTSSRMALEAGGLTVPQAARALRQALSLFAREGAAGLDHAGFARGLAGHLEQASLHGNALRRQIANDGFALSYQPIVRLADRRVHHFEALLRPDASRSLPVSSPQDFVLLAEALGMAGDLDLAVARRACDAASAAGQQVALNLSSQSMQDSGFRARLVGLLSGHAAVKAGLVSVEMTETADMEDVGEARLMVEALRALGITFCLDDFGVGAADVRLLRSLSPDVVKLDGSYVTGVAQPGRERTFAAGVVEMAHAAGAEVVAERIETEAEAAVLLGLGVEYGQGWLFGRPSGLPAAGGDAAARRPARRRGAQDSWG